MTAQKVFNKRAIVRFCAQLKMLLGAGVPLLSAMEVIHSPASITTAIARGMPLSQSLTGFFPPHVIHCLQTAEISGNLEKVLGNLAAHYEKMAQVEEQVKGALVYPAFILALCFLSLLLMLGFVLPGLKMLLLDFQIKPSLFIIFFMLASQWLFWLLILLPFVGIFFALALHYINRTDRGRWLIDQKVVSIRFFRQGMVIQNLHTLAMLLESGVPVANALAALIASTSNLAIKKRWGQIKQLVEDGQSFSLAVAQQNFFPEQLPQMLKIGETSGQLPVILLGLASFFEKEREYFVKRATALIEPALTLTMGMVVALIAAAVFSPMLAMMGQMQ